MNHYAELEFETPGGQQIIVKYDPQDGEIIDICDWHGNEVSDRVYRSAEDRIVGILMGEAEHAHD